MGKKILVVEDERNIVDILTFNLQREGYDTLEALDGPTGLQLALEQNPDLVLLDLMLPGMSGFEVCQKVRQAGSLVPIVMLTAREEEDDKVRGLELGADDYITKPFGIGELRARVKAHLRRETREKKHVVSVNGVRFYLKEKKAYYSGKELGLTKSEYAICEYLALNRGQVFSKDRIYEHVFGYEKESDNSVITEHVKNIRAKGKKAGFEPIETVWGIGYRWR